MQTLNNYVKLYYEGISRTCRLIISGFPINITAQSGGASLGMLNTNYKPIKDMAFLFDNGQNIYIRADEYAASDIDFYTDSPVTMTLDYQMEWTV